uniref:Uncharacterized protein n=1 Tax=Arundo donax TaxID=35708 RepID=A0A0A9HWH6_ARUDO
MYIQNNRINECVDKQQTQTNWSGYMELQHLLLGISWAGPGTRTFFPASDGAAPLAFGSAAMFFLLWILKISVKTVWKAFSTLVACSAEVSRKKRFSFSANSLASSVLTARSSSRSLLLPTSMMMMFLSAWPRSSSSQRGMWSKLWHLVIS